MKKAILIVLTLISLIASHNIVAASVSDKAKDLWGKAKASSPFNNKSKAVDQKDTNVQAEAAKQAAAGRYDNELRKLRRADTQQDISERARNAEDYARKAYGVGSTKFAGALDDISQAKIERLNRLAKMNS